MNSDIISKTVENSDLSYRYDRHLSHVMRDAVQAPFNIHLPEATEQESAHAKITLDITKGAFNLNRPQAAHLKPLF